MFKGRHHCAALYYTNVFFMINCTKQRILYFMNNFTLKTEHGHPLTIIKGFLRFITQFLSEIPHELKHALVGPLLTKDELDLIKKNCHPVPNF